ncbi:hypothetical protein [uncultured Clostridium sp.]|uniref:hypothetical protein n=1 Tax=uncultured Clostridium sp. TaxID=59620 RepID=UPI0026304D44|nr:hypothetical protein [uncultured Clostridium sp.]MCX4253807.1 hypothetical protein [Bacilli bacterium]
MKKRTILLVASLLLLVCGCSLAKEEYSNDHFTITMEKGFTEKELASMTVYYESKKALMSGLKESFESLAAVDIDENTSIEDYGKAVIENNKANYELKEKDGVHYFTYEKEASGKKFFYLASVYKTDDAFWLFNFACDEKNKDTYEPLFLEWAKSVDFK